MQSPKGSQVRRNGTLRHSTTITVACKYPPSREKRLCLLSSTETTTLRITAQSLGSSFSCVHSEGCKPSSCSGDWQFLRPQQTSINNNLSPLVDYLRSRGILSPVEDHYLPGGSNPSSGCLQGCLSTLWLRTDPNHSSFIILHRLNFFLSLPYCNQALNHKKRNSLLIR